MIQTDGRRLAAPKRLPDQIAEHFMARVFTGELAPGTRLPPDRDLAQQLGVDRTSLRMAMQQLSRMGLVKAVRGSGVTVLDYREHAGLDFLAAVFALPQVSFGSGFLLQMLDDWLDLIPFVVGRAFARAKAEDFQEMEALFSRQMALWNGEALVAEIAQIEVALQDRVARLLGNMGFLLFNNSSRPLRARMAQMYFETTDVGEHVKMHRALLGEAQTTAAVSPDELARAYRAKLRERTAALRKRVQTMPEHSTIIETKRRTERVSSTRARNPHNELLTAATAKKRGTHADVRTMERALQPRTPGARATA